MERRVDKKCFFIAFTQICLTWGYFSTDNKFISALIIRVFHSNLDLKISKNMHPTAKVSILPTKKLVGTG